METHGYGNLQNDAAADWLLEWQELRTAGSVEGTLDELLENTSSPVPGLCQEALAAAEVVAAWNGHATPDFDKDVLSVVQKVEVDADELDELKQKSRSVITIVSGDSGLMELWEDTRDIAEWRSALVDLARRLH